MLAGRVCFCTPLPPLSPTGPFRAGSDPLEERELEREDGKEEFYKDDADLHPVGYPRTTEEIEYNDDGHGPGNWEDGPCAKLDGMETPRSYDQETEIESLVEARDEYQRQIEEAAKSVEREKLAKTGAAEAKKRDDKQAKVDAKTAAAALAEQRIAETKTPPKKAKIWNDGETGRRGGDLLKARPPAALTSDHVSRASSGPGPPRTSPQTACNTIRLGDWCFKLQPDISAATCTTNSTDPGAPDPGGLQLAALSIARVPAGDCQPQRPRQGWRQRVPVSGDRHV